MDLLQRSLNSLWLRFCFQMLFSLKRDPWYYTSLYQQSKYDRELSLLPRKSISNALELGCAEGIFTVQLARRVERLVAADISPVALVRAYQRCALQQCDMVHLIQFDLTQDALPFEQFDLIVCSEVLYYVGSQTILQEVTEKLAQALKPGGSLITSNHYRVHDADTDRLRQPRVFGAQVIGKTLAQVPSLQLVKEIRTPFYCTHLFQRQQPGLIEPEIVDLSEAEVPAPTSCLWDYFSLAACTDAWQRLTKTRK
jgi:2-polyprenyl-3-methyl-5-hydroxy-6-metoxy-1,4-benzoquinol methylase